MILPPLYHWSPFENRVGILQHGLQIAHEDEDAREDGYPGVRWPWLCLGSTPMHAWSLMPFSDDEKADKEFDLWQVTLRETDEVKIRSDMGPVVREVRVHHGIPADRVLWVAKRHDHAGIDLQDTSKFDG